MNVGFLGLGKLGLPTALAIETRGHTVMGYDPSPEVRRTIETRTIPYREVHAQEYLDHSQIKLAEIPEVVSNSDIIFVTIQTPHAPLYEGVTRLPDERVDFDYAYLKVGMKDLADAIEANGEDRTVVLVSTVLPGTVEREIRPLLGPHTKLCYNPFFIAMGTTITDFFEPEFVLFGVDDEGAAKRAEAFYKTIHHAPFYRTTIENAELIKVVYNTFISTKIAFINTVMEVCHKLPGTDVDAVTDGLRLATDRVISDKYMRGGMGDGGGCHPRDNIALSWLSRKLDLSFDWFENIMMQREKQTEWLADLVEQHGKGRKLCILGKSFKPETNITVGSPSILLRNILDERGVDVAMWDPYIDPPEALPKDGNMCYFVGTKHPDFQSLAFPQGALVLDPWRYIEDQDGVEIIRIGV